MKTAVAFLIFNRPAVTALVFAAIARARPPRLLVVADGPRHEADRLLCSQARAIVERVDWPCEVLRCYSEENLGCKRRVASGLDWVFSQVEEAIILEDDCLPHADFFPYCEALLERYRHEERIGHIGGTDPRRGPVPGVASYYFSRYPSIWGWATWRRAWQHYDVTLGRWPEIRAAREHLPGFGSAAEANHFAGVWDEIHSGRLDTWDGQWLFTLRMNAMLAVSPNGNLISNIGFDDAATHTRDRAHPFAELPVTSLGWPLTHPETIVCDTQADLSRARAEYLQRPPLVQRLRHLLTNPHVYGHLVRSIPLLGPLWARWRARR